MKRRVGFTVVFLIVTLGLQARERVSVQPKGPVPLDEQTLSQVNLELGNVEVRPGDQRTLRLRMWQCCVYPVNVFADARFSMDPYYYATLNEGGLLQISPNAPPHTSFRVYANIENGRRIVSADVWVDTPQSNPLLGQWQEISDTCSVAGHQIGVLTFGGNGQFTVTWVPFEVYRDYWGYYTFDHPGGHLSMGISGGNYVPPVFAGDGQYTVTTEKDGHRTLVMRGIYLGESRDPGYLLPPSIQPSLCTATFRSYN